MLIPSGHPQRVRSKRKQHVDQSMNHIGKRRWFVENRCKGWQRTQITFWLAARERSLHE